MNRIYVAIAVAVIILGGGTALYFYQNPPASSTSALASASTPTPTPTPTVPSQSTSAPCGQPITYTVGTLDTRFGISQASLLRDSEYAKQRWEKAAGRQLFAYQPDGVLKINLIYGTGQTGGSYTNGSIDIYGYSDQIQLTRLLARLFGSALGLGPVNDPSAVMYPQNQGTNEKLTAADTAELNALCGAPHA